MQQNKPARKPPAKPKRGKGSTRAGNTPKAKPAQATKKSQPRRGATPRGHGTTLTDRQKLFCDIYLGRVREHLECRFRPGEAYKAAGYRVSKASAPKGAYNLLVEEKVQAYIARVMERREQQALLTEQEVAAEMQAMGMARITDALEWDEDGNVRVKMHSDQLPDHVKAGIRSVKQRKEIRYDSEGNRIETVNFEVTMHEKRQPLQDYGRHQHGMWPNRLDVHHKADPANILDRSADEARKRAEKKRANLEKARQHGMTVVVGGANGAGNGSGNGSARPATGEGG